jgi:hypothetical protein
MSIRYALTAGLLTCGAALVAPVSGRAQDAAGLPEKPSPVTVVGCFVHRPDRHPHTYVLASPSLGPATSVPDSACGATGNEQMLVLHEVHEKHLDDSMLGHWIEISGKLGRVRDGDDLRALRVQSFRLVPVAAPRVAKVVPPAEAPAIVTPPAAPQAEAPAPEEAPVATTGVAETLPRTASPLPLIALIGLLAFTAGLLLHLIDRRRSPGRG